MSTQSTNQSTYTVFFVSTFLVIVGIFLIIPRASFASDETRKIVSGTVVTVSGTTVLIDDGDKKITVSTAGAKIVNGQSKKQETKKRAAPRGQKTPRNQSRRPARNPSIPVRVGQRIQVVGNEQESGTVKADRITVYAVNKQLLHL